MNWDQNDQDLLSLVCWREARGEGELGMTAVCCVIANRVGKPGFARTLHDVVMGRNQFSSMSIPTDSQFQLHPKDGDLQYLYCQSLVQQVMAGTVNDPTHGALYYANLKDSTSGWFFNHIVADTVNHPLLATIGHQNFYR